MPSNAIITTDTDDETVVTYPFVLGKYTGRLAGVGKFFMFLKTTPGYIACILVPFLVLILIEGIRCVQLFRQYKAEQQSELKKEREKLESERKETQQMMEELLALKAQLSGQSSDASSAGSVPQTKE